MLYPRRQIKGAIRKNDFWVFIPTVQIRIEVVEWADRHPKASLYDQLGMRLKKSPFTDFTDLQMVPLNICTLTMLEY